MWVSIVTRLPFFHQNENKATQDGGLILFHCIQQILNPDIILETKTLVICCLLPELLRHITGKRRGRGLKEARKEAWKQET